MASNNKILIADDNQANCELLEAYLASVDCEVQMAVDGQDALDKVAQFEPDLILLDVMMPGMDGPQTLTELRKLPVMEGVPVIFMTAKAQTQEVTAYRALGAAGVIIKPFDPMTLSEQIRAIWEQQHG